MNTVLIITAFVVATIAAGVSVILLKIYMLRDTPFAAPMINVTFGVVIWSLSFSFIYIMFKPEQREIVEAN